MNKPANILRYLLSVHLFALSIYLAFRCILYLVNNNMAGIVENKGGLFVTAIRNGLLFDNLISCYIIILPLFVLSLLVLFNRISRIVIKCISIYFMIFYSLTFAVSSANIPFFTYFFSHLDGSIFAWAGFGKETTGIIFGEISNYIYITLFLVSATLFCWFIKRVERKLLYAEVENLQKKHYIYLVPATLVAWILCFLGVRGSVERYPLSISAAYFCDNTFFNQLGINPTFFLIKSSESFLKQKDVLENTIDTKDAIAFVQKEFGITEPYNKNNPISRWKSYDNQVLKPNIVIIFMESMSEKLLHKTYNSQPLTPYLHELIERSYYFENFYSSGIHTNNGIVSTLYGFPAQFRRPMMRVVVDKYTGIPVNLRQHGYKTEIFVTSNPRYDNMNSFLLENGFDRIHSQYDYPKEKFVNNFGVADDYLFQYGLKTLKNTAKEGNPFLATFLTVSNHPPYVVPEAFKDKGEDDSDCIIAFADNAIRYFMEGASKEDWFDNTIFILLGDHGKILNQQGQKYSMALSYNRIPLIIYSPMFKDAPKRFEQMGGQIDVFPTIMGLLNMSYENNTPGIDIFNEKRPFIYFVSNTHLGCVNNKYLYIYDPSEKIESLHDYHNSDTDNLLLQYPALRDSMRQYSISMMETSDYVMSKGLGGSN